ncbi:MAG TPA: accessory factor UbiK family protein [Gammaproteobacteria bacterium]|nr:accessory factor UbiK family protein [Gammaproteobacteria bacterium]
MALKYLNLIKDELGSEFRRGLGVALQKCDLVTREEFDIQTEVLAKTGEKLEKLTRQITMLEEKLKNTP